VPDAGSIGVTFSEVILTGEADGVRTYSVHGSFDGTLPSVDPAGVDTVSIVGSF
jgi:hypothetical protein